jgi:hypothetical protein
MRHGIRLSWSRLGILFVGALDERPRNETSTEESNMTPHELLRGCVSRDRPGIEIGPWFSPIAPKRDGYRTTVVDVRELEELRTQAAERGISPEKIANLEAVDVVGDASRILEILRGSGITTNFGWIISSHNFEHLPDPIGFLTGCGELLEPDGIVGLVLPDKRFCFDRFQPHTTLGGMLRARSRHTDPLEPAWTKFQQKSLAARLVEADGQRRHAWSLATDCPEKIIVTDDIRPAFQELSKSLARGTAENFHGHRWRFTPASFELLVNDLRSIGLVGLEIETICETVGTSFAVRLRRAQPWNPPPEELAVVRSELLRKVEDELAVVSRAYRRLQSRVEELLALNGESTNGRTS